MRLAAALVLAGAALVGPESRPALARLADRFADAIAAAAGGRPVELAPLEAEGRRASDALDLRALTLARLTGRLAVHDDGPRLRVVGALAEQAGRLVVSARLVEEPGGGLAELVSASIETDPRRFETRTEPPRAGRAVDWLGSRRTAPMDDRVLAMAWLPDDRLAVLHPDAAALYRWMPPDLVLLDRHPLPAARGGGETRIDAGVISAATHDQAFWAMTNARPRAVLLGVAGGHLVERSEGDALPWPGVEGGLRFRPGTNLLEGQTRRFGPTPLLAIAPDGVAAAVADDARLLGPGADTGLHVGPTLAQLWDGWIAASSADPPGIADSLLLLRTGDGRLLDSFSIEGAIRALAGNIEGDPARLAAAVEPVSGGTALEMIELRQHRP